jgi:hypothetical protein
MLEWERIYVSDQSTVSKPSLLGMVWSPGEQFERMRERPVFWGALIIVTLLSVAASVILFYAVPDDMYDVPGMQLTEEQLAMAKTMGAVTAVLGALIGTPIGILISALIMFLITKLAQKDTTFRQLFSLNTYIMFISGIGQLLNALIRLAIGGDPVVFVTSLGSLVEAEGMTAEILGGIELFSIWATVLTAIGLYKVGRLSKGAAWTVAIVIFVIGLIFSVVGGVFSGTAGV